MTDHKKPWFKERMARQSFLYHIEKPFTIGVLTNAVFVGLNLRDEGIHLEGMTMASVLPIVEIVQKTCRIKVASKGHGTGYLYFNDGIIVDAHYKALRHDTAADEISKWNNINITLSELPQRRKRTRVKKKIMDLAGASWDKNGSLERRNKEEALPESDFIEPISESEIVLLESIDDILNKFLDQFCSIEGFHAIAMTGKNGEILTFHQQDDRLNIDRIVKESLKALLVSQHTAQRVGFKKCEAITLHTQSGVVVMVPSKSASDAEFNLVGITTPQGDWVGMKKRLEEMVLDITASSISTS